MALQFVDGSEQRFRNYQSPLHQWVIALSLLDQSELHQLQEFFRAMVGASGDVRVYRSMGRCELSELQRLEAIP